MLTIKKVKILSSLLYVLLIVLCFSLFSCKGNVEDNGSSDVSDSSYENTDSASAESVADGAQNTDDTTTEGSTENESSATGFNKSELGGNEDSISWDDLTNGAKKH